MDEKYGVPRDIYAKVKILGLFMADIGLVGGSAVAALSIAPKYFPTSQWVQMLLFILMTPVMTLYLVLPTNGGKKNWHSMLLFFRRKRKRYVSVNYMRGGKH